MKVFKIGIGPPLGVGHAEYACLNPKNKDGHFLSLNVGNGVPCTVWRNIELYVFNPSAIRPDIFSAPSIVFSQKARSCVGHLLEKSGQLLPLTIQGESGTHYLYNCTTLVDALDPDHSIWLHYKETNRSRIDVPSFHAKRLNKVTLFMLPRGQLAGLYAVERTGDYRDAEFKALVEHHGLTGLRFDLLWSDKDGPALPQFLHDKDAPLEHRTADGKPWVFSKPKATATRPATVSNNKLEATNNKRKRG